MILNKKKIKAPICKFCGKSTIVQLVPRTIQILSDGTLLQQHFCRCRICGAIEQDFNKLVSIGYIEELCRKESE